jgi:hypothetical protein
LGIVSHAYMVVRAPRDAYGLKVLLPHRISLVAEWKECEWHHGGVSKAAPTQ